MALELAVLLVVMMLGTATFAVFEVETAPWRKVVKWSIVSLATLALHAGVGHMALALPIGLGIVGLAVHFAWCRKHGIDPWHATPRRRYYELRGWSWPE